MAQLLITFVKDPYLEAEKQTTYVANYSWQFFNNLHGVWSIQWYQIKSTEHIRLADRCCLKMWKIS